MLPTSPPHPPLPYVWVWVGGVLEGSWGGLGGSWGGPGGVLSRAPGGLLGVLGHFRRAASPPPHRRPRGRWSPERRRGHRRRRRGCRTSPRASGRKGGSTPLNGRSSKSWLPKPKRSGKKEKQREKTGNQESPEVWSLNVEPNPNMQFTAIKHLAGCGWLRK